MIDVDAATRGLLSAPVEEKNFDQFRAAVSESFVPLQVTSNRPDTFTGRIHGVALDEVNITEVSASSHTVERTPSLIARGGTPYYKLSLQVAGTGFLVQDTREAVLQPGDFAIYDTTRPYSLVFDDEFRVVVMMFPRHLIDLPTDMVGEVTAVTIGGSGGVGSIVAPFISQLASKNTTSCGPLTRSRLANNALDLVSTVIASQMDLESASRDPHRSLRNHIHSFIEANLASTNLSPARIAAEHYISTRHLHALFREQGTTVSSWIRSRRLEQCRRELLDPLQTSTPVAAVAARWGFVDAAHFSRIFKATYGQPPSDLRQTRR